MTKPFIPSSSKLMSMIAEAEAAFDEAREQAALKREPQADERAARAEASAIRARHYARIQRGEA